MSTANTITETIEKKREIVMEPDWCPGCGDFGVLRSLSKATVQKEIQPHEMLVVSGIGCSSNLPGYIQGYGVHSLHGRALPVATGAKLANHDLKVVVTGGKVECEVGEIAWVGRLRLNDRNERPTLPAFENFDLDGARNVRVESDRAGDASEGRILQENDVHRTPVRLASGRRPLSSRGVRCFPRSADGQRSPPHDHGEGRRGDRGDQVLPHPRRFRRRARFPHRQEHEARGHRKAAQPDQSKPDQAGGHDR